MDLIAHNIVDLHSKLDEFLKTLDWNEDYETILGKEPDGFTYQIKKKTDAD